MSRLAKLNLTLLALLALHVVDHAINQPTRDLPVTGGFVGVAGFAVVAASSVLAVRRSQWAPAAAVFAGLTTALGFAAIHLLPAWSEPISDPYWDFAANALSWVLMLAPLAVSIVLAAQGARELRQTAPIAM